VARLVRSGDLKQRLDGDPHGGLVRVHRRVLPVRMHHVLTKSDAKANAAAIPKRTCVFIVPPPSGP
jgi:hypothetical protein